MIMVHTGLCLNDSLIVLYFTYFDPSLLTNFAWTFLSFILLMITQVIIWVSSSSR